MNITHIQAPKIEGDRLKAIFEKQRSLMEKYETIEEKSGLLQTHDIPVNLNDKRGQARIKDFSWRITEEVGEALDAQELEHFHEELIDGLHFLTELTILAGRDYNTITDFEPYKEKDYLQLLFNDAVETDIEDTHSAVVAFIKELGMMCNCLKNKPWKQTQMLTDKPAFYRRLERAWIAYMSILRCASLTPDTITDIYFRKNAVNVFRQGSNY